ncbi:hypothetical protein ACFCY7_08050, partial [Streptomyces sp. NPDC056361]
MFVSPVFRRAATVAAAATALVVPVLPSAGAATVGAAEVASGRAWYLDCSAASDGDGSQSAPWKTLAAANAHVFQPG